MMMNRLSIRHARCAALEDTTVRVRATVLLIADRPAPSAEENSYPFCSTKHCSCWLNRQLDEHNIQEQNLLWLNSSSKSGVAVDLLILDRIDCEYICLLGKKAEEWARNINHRHVIGFSHPQFHRRFKASEPYPLIEFLKTV